MKDAQQIFAATCRRLREEARMTQDELGEAADLSGAYISEIERGNANPTLLTIQKLADGLGVHISVLTDFREVNFSDEEIRQNLIRAISKANNKSIKEWYKFVKKAFP